ncbi:Uncharacterized protein TPAR_00757 [Tolypocladium paradoxum]|uniref:Uncharacterized protein n=1 Tax=Tolypocladium paradoxum TaxID=94208 RepID=A0A2S4L9B6_9HYPO|nr:Uncharacterized protein TPAR_00757 [Tolypocladium paradoxum]
MRPSLARALKWIWKGSQYPWLVQGLDEVLPKIGGSLNKKAVSAVVHGDAHETTNRHGQVVDPLHVSGAILTEKGSQLSSFHAYPNGKIEFSKKKYGTAYFTPKDDSRAGQSSQSQLATGLTWNFDETSQTAVYWDGEKWEPGQWSEEHNTWVALYDGVWYAM